MRDPIILLLTNVVLRKFYAADLDEAEKAFVEENARKHRMVLWVTLGCSLLFFLGLREVRGDMGTIVTALLAPVMVLGGAWFAVSFGGVPVRLMDAAMEITVWMFTAFLVSFAGMFLTVGFLTPPVMWPVLGLIFVGAVMSCIQYDTADGLKAGLDEAMLKHSRAALRYYRQHGITPEDERAGSEVK